MGQCLQCVGRLGRTDILGFLNLADVPIIRMVGGGQFRKRE